MCLIEKKKNQLRNKYGKYGSYLIKKKQRYIKYNK